MLSDVDVTTDNVLDIMKHNNVGLLLLKITLSGVLVKVVYGVENLQGSRSLASQYSVALVVIISCK